MESARKTLEGIKEQSSIAKQTRQAGIGTRIIVGTATCGVSAGAKAVVDALKQEVEARKLEGVDVMETGCSGRCDLEPLVQVVKEGHPPSLYYHVDAEKARRIVQQHVQNNEPIKEWILS